MRTEDMWKMDLSHDGDISAGHLVPVGPCLCPGVCVRPETYGHITLMLEAATVQGIVD